MGDAQWDELKQVICIKAVDTDTGHVCHSQLLEDDGGWYTYTPIDEKFRPAVEGSPEHVYYSVEFRDYIRSAILNYKWPAGEKAPDTGRTHHGKPVVSQSRTFSSYGVDTSLVRKYKVLHYLMRNQDREDCYLLGLGEDADLSSLDLSETTNVQGFLQDNQFQNIKVLQPPERYAVQPVLTNARYAFSLYDTCASLDIRGLKFDRDTDAMGLFHYTAIAPVLLAQYNDDVGLRELVLTPEQYALFTAKDCQMKDRELERFHHNATVHRNHVLDGSSVREEETPEEAMARVNRYLAEDLKGLEDREYGSFFFQGLYDQNQIDTMNWEALKTILVVKPLSHP